MSFQSQTVAEIAAGVAVGSILLTSTVFLLLRRHEALVAAKKEAMMAPIVREKKDRNYYIRRIWLKDFHEDSLRVCEGDPDEINKYYVTPYLGRLNGLNFNSLYCVPDGAPPRIDPATLNGTDPAPHDIQAALSHYFDNQLELGIDHRIIDRMLFHGNERSREHAMDFLMNKAALSFTNFESNHKYTILPPKIMDLADEISARGFKALDDFEDKGVDRINNENRFPELWRRWRTLTFKLYGRETMPPEVQLSIDRRIDFLMTIFNPLIKPESVGDARRRLQEKIRASQQLALWSASQNGLFIHDWNCVGPGLLVAYVGEPEVVPRFDMMAEKALVIQPAWLQVTHSFHGRPFIRGVTWTEAKVIRYTDKEWARWTEGLEF